MTSPRRPGGSRPAGSSERRPADAAPSLVITGDVDPAALLVALVLVPGSYARNRFEPLYRHADARRVRRRAAMVRSIIGDLLWGVVGQCGELSGLQRDDDGSVQLMYRVPAVGLSRSCRLTPLELDLIRFAVVKALAAGDGQRRWRPARGLELLTASEPLPSGEQLGRVARGLLR